MVSVIQQDQHTLVFCDCGAKDEEGLCPHQFWGMSALLQTTDYELFFDPQRRHAQLKKTAYDYGLENAADPDEHFLLTWSGGRLIVSPRNPSLIPVTKEVLQALMKQVIGEVPTGPGTGPVDDQAFIVFKKHKYYKYLQLELCQAARTKDGKIKNPITQVVAEELLWKTTQPDILQFVMGITRLQNRTSEKLTMADLEALQAVLKNPMHLPFYHHTAEISDKITAGSLDPVEIKLLTEPIRFLVDQALPWYTLSAQVSVNGTIHPLQTLTLRHQAFLQIHSTWYLIHRLPELALVQLLFQKSGKLMVPKEAFQEFRTQFLQPVADQVKLEYQFIPTATTTQLTASGFQNQPQKLLYLSDFGSHVMLIPTMRYGDVEVPVRSQRRIYGIDNRGKEFEVIRDERAEQELIALIIRQHPDFSDQQDNPLDHFYLHKRQFLQEEWFLPVFEQWQAHGISVLGFNQLEGNRLNPHRVKVTIQVSSGINWFNAEVNVRFGKQRAALKKLQVAVKNKSKYVELDDGTLGLLPQEWISRFKAYFTAGDLTEADQLRIAGVKFNAVEELFDPEMLDVTARRHLQELRQRIQDFSAVTRAPVPPSLQSILRPYQAEGLSWLNFLDDFQLGGCLADDMGLGKSLQILAFMLLLREKTPAISKTHLLVVPTTLLFNWQKELAKYAPELTYLVLHGADRARTTQGLEKYDLVITTYNTLISDVSYLRSFSFDYLLLDEAQQIKNPDSQRYKAARMLKARNRIVITGTPLENNTFDLYSLFSFCCPGLFGTRRDFLEQYAVPVDQFKIRKKAALLQQKIRPFLLRRTKEQVIRELPQKTEMICYCPMEEEQRRVYDAYEQEFREFISATDADELQKNSMHVLRGLTKLRQICNSVKLLKSDEITGEKTSSKIDQLMEQLETQVPFHKVLIFSQFVSMLELIRQELLHRGIGYALLTGSTIHRESVVTQFQEDPQCRVFLISLKAGGTGLNLTEASYVYLIDPWWNPAVENQAIDRAYRIGQHRNVTAIRFICPNTVEEKITELQATKQDLSSRLVTGGMDKPGNLTKEELLRLLS